MRTRTTCGALLRAAAAALTFVLAGPAHLASAQTPFVPYFGKNQIHYSSFDWHVYTTEHFEIYYYPEIEQHLERISGYAESAYQQISSELKHDLAFKVPLILFKTSSEFQQQNVIPGAAQEGVGAFAEPTRDRVLMPMDEPTDLMYRLIVHELTHIFEFDIIPTSLIRRDMPLWVNEGLSDYMTGIWRPIDLMTVRDAAVSDIVPKMSELQGYGNFTNPRLIYNLGHATFEFIESRWGKEGLRQFLFSLRKSVIGGGEDAYEEAFKMKPDEFDQQFERYLKERFKPFRDKERPADYGRNLAPNPEKTTFSNALSIEPSPSGDLLAVYTGNRKDREYDIVILSAKDGSVVRNVTRGFDKDMGFEYLAIPGDRWNTISWMSWGPKGDRIAYFARREKDRVLVVQNVLTRKIEERIPMTMVDEPESPAISPDGRSIVFSGLQHAIGDLFQVNLETKEVINLTKDAFADSGPTWAPDARSLVYVSRISGSEKLFRLDLATGKKAQLTFGTHDDGQVKFVDEDTVVFTSTATDPTQSPAPEVSRNGNIYNLWTLNLKTGDLKQWTDAVGGAFSPVVLKTGEDTPPKIAFVSYYKGDYGLNTLDRKDPLARAATSDFGAPGPVIDFQAPMSHTLVTENKKRKGAFEKLFLDGRPPVNVGVTSGGDVFGGSQITFSDVLGDKQFALFAASVSQYRTISGSYANISSRFQYALQGYSQTQFFYGQSGGVFYDPALSPIISRDLAVATRTVRGATAFGIWPLDRYRRVEVSGGVNQYNEAYADPSLETYSQQYQQQVYGRTLFRNGASIPIGLTFVQETTVFREFGPLAGNTVRLGYEYAPGGGSLLGRQTLDLDARLYQRLGGSGLLALRARTFKSWGSYPDFTYFGGNSEMRGYDYLSFLGQKATFLNAELRFPLIEAMLTPLGVLGGIRGVIFGNVGGASFNDQPYTFWSNKTERYTPIVGYNIDNLVGTVTPIAGSPVAVSGLRLVDARASYGLGLETFALGFPIHFDWSWKTLFNRDWEDQLFAASGGSSAFRKAKFAMWIGYDF